MPQPTKRGDYAARPPRQRCRARIAVGVLAVLGPAVARADLYWVGGSGPWADAANWSLTDGGPGGAGVPDGSQGLLYFRTTDGVGRTISLSPDAIAGPLPASDVFADAFGPGALTLTHATGDLSLGALYLGHEGSAAFHQTGGTATLSTLSLSRNWWTGGGAAAASSSYVLAAGQLVTSTTQLGNDQSVGTFVQTGGTHTTGDVFVDVGRYDVAGGTLRADALRTNAVVRQTGGTIEAGVVSVDRDTARFELDAGQLSATTFDSGGTVAQTGGSIAVDRFRQWGTYQWSGGTLAVKEAIRLGGAVTFPLAPVSIELDGQFYLDPAATLTNASSVSVRLGPHSVFTRPATFDATTAFANYENLGLEHVAGQTLTVPAGRSVRLFEPLDRSPIDVRGAVVAGTLDSPGTLRAGGSLTVDQLNRPGGTFRVLGGTFAAAQIDLARTGGQSSMIDQSAGAVDVTGTLAIGATGQGLYRMTGGHLDSTTVVVGPGSGYPYGSVFESAPSGDFYQSGGTHVARSAVRLGRGRNATGSYVMAGGHLETPILEISAGAEVFPRPISSPPAFIYGSGRFEIANPAADIRVTSELAFGPDALFGAVPGSTIQMGAGARLVNLGTDPDALAGLANLRLVFSAETAPDVPALDSAPATLELASADLGPDPAGFFANFALGTLEVGGPGVPAALKLVDLTDNHPGLAGTETLYVTALIVHPGSTLDLGAFHVYAQHVQTDGANLVAAAGNAIMQVPEPAVAIVGVAALVLGPRRRGTRR